MSNLNVNEGFIHVAAAAASSSNVDTASNHSSGKQDDNTTNSSSLADNSIAPAALPAAVFPPGAGRRNVGTLNRTNEGEYTFVFRDNDFAFATFEKGIGFAQAVNFTRMKEEDEEQWLAYLTNDRKSGSCTDEVIMVFEK